jgi:hypothetical protein
MGEGTAAVAVAHGSDTRHIGAQLVVDLDVALLTVANDETRAGEVGRGDLGEIVFIEQRHLQRSLSSANAAICAALRQLIQSSPAGFSSSTTRADVIMPRSLTDEHPR